MVLKKYHLLILLGKVSPIFFVIIQLLFKFLIVPYTQNLETRIFKKFINMIFFPKLNSREKDFLI